MRTMEGIDRPRSYLDWNATAPVLPEVVVAMTHALSLPGNPSSVHAEGRAARALVEQARVDVAALVGGSSDNVVFTSGGTEAAQTVLSPCLGKGLGPHGVQRLFVSAVEHPCVLAGGSFDPDGITRIAVDRHGRLDLAALEEALASAGGPVLLSLQAANNETGVIQPVAEAASLVHAAGGLVHVDAVQAAGRVQVDLARLGADVTTLSAHKLGGPKGIGAIVFAHAGLRSGESLIRGGGQERGQRAGTENVPGIAGFGAAARIARERLSLMDDVGLLRDSLERGIRERCPDAIVFAADVPRLPNTTCFAVAGLLAETALIGFDMDGVAVSSGSACSSGKVRPSHVLAAMGVDEQTSRSAIRVSLGATTTSTDVTYFLSALETRLGTLDRKRGLAA